MSFVPNPNWNKVAKVDARLPALLAHCGSHFRERELIVSDLDRATYGEVIERSGGIALRLLAAGIGKGSRVGILIPNSAAFIAVWWAVARIGAVAVPISTLSTPSELAKVLRHSDVALLIAITEYRGHEYAAKLEEAFAGLRQSRGLLALAGAPYLRAVWLMGDCDRLPWATPFDETAPRGFSAELLASVEAEVAPGDPMTIVYTSGSTAEPKGVVHSHGTLLREAAKLAAFSAVEADDRVYSPQQFFWVGGLTYSLLRIVFAGATIVTSAKGGEQLLDVLEREAVTFMVSWPHQARALAAHPAFRASRFPAMRAGELVEAIPEHLRPADPGLVVMPLGMTETAGPHGVIELVVPEHLRGSCGVPMPGMEYRLVDIGRAAEVADGDVGVLQLRGDTLFVDMVKRERRDVLTPDGWYDTGDLCIRREGQVFFQGRADDMIKAAGANVSPREVEEVLLATPGISRAIVLSVPDDARGAVVGAVVVRQEGAALTAEDLRASASSKLSSFKVPKVIVFMQDRELPVQHTGKLDRRALQRRLQDEHKRRR